MLFILSIALGIALAPFVLALLLTPALYKFLAWSAIAALWCTLGFAAIAGFSNNEAAFGSVACLLLTALTIGIAYALDAASPTS